MDNQQSQKLIDTLMSLIGYWEYAEDIIVNIREGSISDTDAEELAKILSNALNQAKGDEDFVRMTIAYETSNLWKNKFTYGTIYTNNTYFYQRQSVCYLYATANDR